jgi:hypothetical protein
MTLGGRVRRCDQARVRLTQAWHTRRRTALRAAWRGDHFMNAEVHPPSG